MARRAPIGELRHRVSLQSPTDTIDAYGQEIRTWSTYATVWARVEQTPGSETQAGQSQLALSPHRITIRYRTDVMPTHRLVYGSITLELVSVTDETGYGTHLVLAGIQSQGAVTTTTTTTTATP